MQEKRAALILTEQDKLIRGFVDSLGSLTIGTTTYIAEIDGIRRTIPVARGEEIQIVATFVLDKSPPLHLIMKPPKRLN